MDVINRIRLKISGTVYTISTPEDEEYVQQLAQRINKSLDGIMRGNPTLSVNDALVLCLLDCADEREKSERNADHIRDQLTGYLEDAAKSRMEADELRAEVARLRREVGLIKKENEKQRSS